MSRGKQASSTGVDEGCLEIERRVVDSDHRRVDKKSPVRSIVLCFGVQAPPYVTVSIRSIFY